MFFLFRALSQLSVCCSLCLEPHSLTSLPEWHVFSPQDSAQTLPLPGSLSWLSQLSCSYYAKMISLLINIHQFFKGKGNLCGCHSVWAANVCWMNEWMNGQMSARMNGQMSAWIREIWKGEKLKDLIVVFIQDGFLMMIITITIIIIITTSSVSFCSTGLSKGLVLESTTTHSSFNSVPVLEGFWEML